MTEKLPTIADYEDIHECKSEWISIKDRYPDEEGTYLVFVECEDGKGITILYYRDETKFFWMMNVTHWMPLPEFPNEQ